jgi:hypothetical protein
MTEVTSGVIVHMRHIRQARLCARGARAWFTHHGLPYAVFLDAGLPVEVIEATGDKMAFDVAKVARDEHGIG